MTLKRQFLCWLAILVLLAACGGLASEPEIISTSSVPTITPTSPPDLGHPPERVSLARAADIFGGQQGCAACHGITGKGDGSVAASFACTLPNFTDAEATRGQTIEGWFAIVSDGNNGTTTCLMPPWRSRLNEQQRWDVTSYIYSLHYTPDMLTQGKAVWEANCAACHGETAAGDGPKAKSLPRPVPKLADPAVLITHSDTDLWNTVTNGFGPVMPSFKTTLTDDQRWDAVAYLRSLTWDPATGNAGVIATAEVTGNSGVIATAEATEPAAGAATGAGAGVVATEEATPSIPDTPTIKVSGKVTNGTTNTPTGGLALTLRVIDNSGSTIKDTLTVNATSAADGTFSFGDVQRQNNMVYVVVATYANVQQFSNPIRMITGSGPTLDLSFPVYETTNDPTAIRIESSQTFLSPYSQNTLLVRQALSFSNSTSRIFVGTIKLSNGGLESTETTVPAGAQQVQLTTDIAAQYEIDTANGATVIRGAVPLIPGEVSGLEFTYLLPYTGQPSLTLPQPYTTQNFIVYMPQTSGFILSDPVWSPRDPLQLGDGVYNQYAYLRQLRPNEAITIALSDQTTENDQRRNLLAVVLLLSALAITGIVLAITRLNRQGGAVIEAPVPSSFDGLVQNIADLDDRYEKGKIPQAEYEAQRATLKAALARLIEGT